jgi:UDP-glucose 4-epimerase
MKILVTGGAGFIGSHVADLFISEGHEVIIVDNLSSGQEKNINSKATFHQMDIGSQDFFDLIVSEKPDVIDHHAAHIHVGKSVEDPVFDAKNNILATINMMQAAKEAGSVKKVIFASTGGAMYGNKQTPFDESMMPQPLSPYGISKRSAELYLYFYFNQYQIPFIALRYANVYGPRQNPHGEAGVISIFLDKLNSGETPIIFGDGSQTRDYVFVGDVAKANLLALSSSQISEFNIGTSIETDVNQIYSLVAKYYKTEVKAEHGPARAGEQKTSNLSFYKAKKDLSWEPSVSLEEGIEKTVQYFKSA